MALQKCPVRLLCLRGGASALDEFDINGVAGAGLRDVIDSPIKAMEVEVATSLRSPSVFMQGYPVAGFPSRNGLPIRHCSKKRGLLTKILTVYLDAVHKQLRMIEV
jgi:hypothetical protein